MLKKFATRDYVELWHRDIVSRLQTEKDVRQHDVMSLEKQLAAERAERKGHTAQIAASLHDRIAGLSHTTNQNTQDILTYAQRLTELSDEVVRRDAVLKAVHARLAALETITVQPCERRAAHDDEATTDDADETAELRAQGIANDMRAALHMTSMSRNTNICTAAYFAIEPLELLERTTADRPDMYRDVLVCTARFILQRLDVGEW